MVCDFLSFERKKLTNPIPAPAFVAQSSAGAFRTQPNSLVIGSFAGMLY
jgi:hypothetical protein